MTPVVGSCGTHMQCSDARNWTNRTHSMSGRAYLQVLRKVMMDPTLYCSLHKMMLKNKMRFMNKVTMLTMIKVKRYIYYG